MTSVRISVAIVLALGLAWTAGPLAVSPAAQGTHERHAPFGTIPLDILQRPVPLRKGTGIAREKVGTSSTAAQAYYDQGLAHLHSFSWIEAARSFHTALREDAALAMAHLGLSFAYGGLGSLEGARAALEDARRLAPGAGDRDRLRITLRGQQLQALANPGDPSLAAAYRGALDRALEERAGDVELLLLRGQAGDGVERSAMTSGRGAVPFYERATAIDPEAFAPHHYLIHAYENIGRHDLALRHGEIYARRAPAVPHAHHMYAHGLRRAGRVREAIAAFQKADGLEKAYFASEGIPQRYDWHYHHNQLLMASAFRYLGQLTKARTILDAVVELPAPLLAEELGKRQLAALRLASGDAAGALAAAKRLAAHRLPLVRAAGHLAAARAHMQAGRLDAAGASADDALRELRAAGPEAAVLASDLRLVQGEFFLRGGEGETGRAMIRRGVTELRAHTTPDAWSETLFELEALGKAARDAGDAGLASELADQMRQHDAGYGGTHYALARAAEARGDRAAALSAYAEAVRLWADADRDLPDAVDARRRLEGLRAAR
jgi:tetratricopeptide (TPR) repeat protein